MATSQLEKNVPKQTPAIPKKDQDSPERFKIVSEMLSSERKYVELLNVLNSVYIVPLEASVELNPIIDRFKISAIFGTVGVIKNLNENFYYKMKEILSKWNKNSVISDIFIDFGHYFKIYMSYVNNQRTAVNILKEELKINHKFKEFCDKCINNPMSMGQTLTSFLILPIQRIPRYRLLLKDLLKKTPESHVDYKNLKKAYELIGDVTEKINQAIAEHENSLKMLEIQESFLGNVVFIEPRRKFLHEGVLTKVCRSSEKRYTFFLFTNLLVYASASGNKFRLHRSIEIDEVFRIVDLPDTEKKSNRFQIVSTKKSFNVLANSKEDKQKWIEMFNSAMDNKIKPSSTQKTESTLSVGSAPVWQPDLSSKICFICENRFSVFNRRHHCRKCGQLVCSGCSKTRTLLKFSEEKSVRICDLCARDSANADSSSAALSNQTGEKKKFKKYVAKFDYVPRSQNELPLKKGQEVVVINKDASGWWTGVVGSNVGVFPSNYVEPDTVSKSDKSFSKAQNKAQKGVFGTLLSPFKSKEEPKAIKGTEQKGLKEKKRGFTQRDRSKILSSMGSSMSALQKSAIFKEENILRKCTELVKKEKENWKKTLKLEVRAGIDHEDFDKDGLSFSKKDRLLVSYVSREQNICFGTNRETWKSGWFPYEAVGHEKRILELEKTNIKSMYTLCTCPGFSPNAFRRSLCKECQHSIALHTNAGADVKEEGGSVLFKGN